MPALEAVAMAVSAALVASGNLAVYTWYWEKVYTNPQKKMHTKTKKEGGGGGKTVRKKRSSGGICPKIVVALDKICRTKSTSGILTHENIH